MIEQDIPKHVPAHLVQSVPFHAAPGIERDPPPTMDVLRDDRPIVYSPATSQYGASWVLKDYDLLVEAFQAPEQFSSDHYAGFAALIGEDWAMPPMELDPPHNMPFRILLTPLFSPRRMATLEEGVTDTVKELLEELRPKGECEFQSAFGVKLPTTVFLRLVGLPLEDAPMLLDWERELMHGETVAQRIAGARSIKDYLQGHINDRERNRRDDVISDLVHAEVEGRPLTPGEKIGMCFLLYAAGLDTVASALGFTFRFLALNPERQQELRERPDQRNMAIEEMLRAHMNNIPSRFVTKDLVFHGVEMKKGERVSLATMFGNRDPAKFPAPAKVDFDRPNAGRHIAFGSGVHNCIGKHLARRELRLALDGWLNDMPAFHVGKREPVTYGGSVFGVSSLDLAWTPPAG